MPVISDFPRVGQFVGVSRDQRQKHYPDLRLLVYGAYDAGGLIGSEFNGIAVLDERERRVLTDREAQEPSGYNGPSARQIRRFEELAAMPQARFAEWLKKHDNYRGGWEG